MIASGEGSHAEGGTTTASGQCSHAEGANTTASGIASHASGNSTIASSDYQTAIGKYNAEDSNMIFIVGNGTYSSRSNAFGVGYYGSIFVPQMPTGTGSTCYWSNNEIVKASSSQYLKHDIEDVKDFDCTKLYDIPVRQFIYNNDESETPTLGLIADEVAENFNVAALYDPTYREGKDPSDWSDRIVIAGMLKLIQEQHTQIEELKEQIEALK